MRIAIAVLLCACFVWGAPDIYWNCDTISGTSLAAVSPAGHTFAAEVKGNGTLADGKTGKALQFDGTSTYAAVTLGAGGQTVVNRGAFTVMLWVNPDSVTGRRPLIMKRTSNNATSFGLTIRGKLFVFEACDKTGKWSYICNSDKTQIMPNVWTHLAAVVEEGKAVKLYVNGALVRTHAVNAPLSFNSEDIQIGRDAWGGDPESTKLPGFYAGRMDEIKFFGSALAAEAIAGEMASEVRKDAMISSTFYVSPSGNDTDPGTLEKPFATPARALLAARGSAGKTPVSIELRGGAYMLSETLKFTSADSGTPDAPVIWRSYEGETAVISGGRVVNGLRESTVNGMRRWNTDFPDVKSGERTFRQLFIKQRGKPYERRYRPHIGMKRVDGLTYSPRRKAAAHRAAQIDFQFAPGDFKSWENLSDIEVVVLHVWSSSRLFVKEIDTKRNVVTFTGMPTFAVDQGGLQPYFIENVKEELDAPGEWYLDRPTGSFTYLPLTGETIGDTRLVVPALSTVISFSGDYSNEAFVSNIILSNIVISHNESPLPKEGYGGSQGQPDLPAIVEMTGAKHCALVRCTVSQTGNYGVAMGLGCQENRVTGCRLFDLGGGGVKVGDLRMDSKAKYPVLPTGNIVENCAISDGGIMYYSANAVWGGIVSGTKILHNAIWNFSYSGIAVGWNWSDTPTSCSSNIIAYNHISNVLTVVADGASIYTLGRQPGTVIRGNVLRDNIKSPFAKEFWQLGLYLDEGSSEMIVENNFVWRVGTHGFNINSGAQNIIRNNVMGPVYGNHAPYIRSAKKSYARDNIFTRNISYCDSENMADEPWDKSLFLCSSNIYWNFAGKTFTFKDKSFAEWQAMGQDAGSLIADPLLENSTTGDAKLKPSSPAFALGFVAFDTSEAGLTAAYRDVATPVKVTEPPFFAMKLAEPRAATGFSFDFEDIPLGVAPRGFACNGCTPEANFQVVEGTAKSGKRSLMATDSKSAPKPFYPYLTHMLPKHLEKGTVIFTFSVMQKKEAPAAIDIAFRDYSKKGNAKKEFVSAAGVMFSAAGTVSANGTEIATAPPGTWTTVTISLSLGSARTTDITVTLADGTVKKVSSPLSDEFAAVSWIGFVCGDTVDGVCYIDDISLDLK